MENRSALDTNAAPPFSPGPPGQASTGRSKRQGRPPENEKRDVLTGLHKQRYLARAIDACLKQNRRRGLSATLALLQLENFYEIRSWVGISEADLLLSDIAQLLLKSLPQRVLLCRCHNYEFAALLVADCSINAGLITEKLKQAVLSAVSPSLPPQLELKCGVGLAKLDSNIPSWPVVFARARHNLSLAHHQRELCTDASSIAPDVVLQQLEAALEPRELALNFQAWAHLREGSPEHYELRCALASRDSGLPTSLLFEAAARNAQGERIDRRIIKQIIAERAEELGPQRRLIVNLSHNSVVSIAFQRWLEERLAGSPTLAAGLVFQISEIDALIAQHHLLPFCDVIRKLGSAISLSNFGCTPNPLRYLSLVPASYVKLDPNLISKIDVNQDKLERLRQLVAELHARRIGVVAPMLEQLRLLPPLWQAGADYLQGHCLHRSEEAMNYKFMQSLSVNFG